jgi:2-polyprenyl-3-methyl-5-hydroxy-6-metoxy-1,4-benzoquinol methylase
MQSVQSYNTAISRKRASVPLRYLQDKGHLKGAILDYGCGKGADFNHLKQAGYTAEAYDPHWKPIDLTGMSFDTVLCTYVLNVVSAEAEDEILKSIKSLLKKGGQAFIAVRRDIKKDGRTSRGYQRTVSLDLSVVKENSGYCIYSLSN